MTNSSRITTIPLIAPDYQMRSNKISLLYQSLLILSSVASDTHWGGRYEGSKENSSGIDRCWQLGLVRTCPGAEAFAGVRDHSCLQPTQGSGEGGRYGVWHSSRSREFECVGDGPIGRPGPGADDLSAT